MHLLAARRKGCSERKISRKSSRSLAFEIHRESIKVESRRGLDLVDGQLVVEIGRRKRINERDGSS